MRVCDSEFTCEREREREAAGDICRALRESEKAAGAQRIYTAGEKEWEIWQERQGVGVPVNAAVQKEMCVVREEMGLHSHSLPFEV